MLTEVAAVQGMRDLLRSSLASSLRSWSEEDRLAAALPVVCGTALASHCAVEGLDEERTLHLRVQGREWLGPLLAMRDVLQHDLARISGVALAGLHFAAARQASFTEGAEPAQAIQATARTAATATSSVAEPDRKRKPYPRRRDR